MRIAFLFAQLFLLIVSANASGWGSYAVDGDVPFMYRVGQGKTKYEWVTKFGTNPNVGTTEENVWEESTIYTYPASPSSCTISSTSSDDDAGGTGAITVWLEYLTTDYVRVREVLTLDGQNGVALSSPLLRFHRAIVYSTGSGGENAGIIRIGTGTVTSGVPATTYGRISIGDNQSQHGMYTIPRGYTGLLLRGTIYVDSTKSTIWEFYTRDNDEGFPFQEKLTGVVSEDTYTFSPVFGFPLDETTDIDLRVISSSAGSEVDINFAILLERKPD